MSLSRQTQEQAGPWEGDVESLLLDQIDAAVIALDLDRTITHWNAHAEALYGWARDEVLGRDVSEIGFAPPNDETESLMERLERGESWEYDIERCRRDGTRFLALVKGAPLRCPSGRLIGFVSVSVDVTERRRSETSLRRLNAELIRARRMARLSSWEWDIVRGRARFSDSAGGSSTWVSGTLDELIAIRVHPDDRERVRQVVAQAVEAGRGWTLDFRRLAPDGAVRHVSATAELVTDAAGRPAKVLGTSQDVTEQREALHALQESEQARRRLLRQLVSAQDDERSRLAADIHDDAIQVLHAAVLRAEALSERLTAPDQLEAAQRLEENLRQAVANLRNIVAGVRLPALGGADLVPALEVYIAEATADWPVRHRLESRLDREPRPEVSGVLFRIVAEAIVNARRHSDASALTVTLESADGGVKATVADDGRGFSPPADEPVDAGHWGLATMKERAESCGGWLRIDSGPEGTSISTWIPDPTAQR